MTINGEEVELVTDFDQLRAGVITYVRSCEATGCGREWCRGMLTRRSMSTVDGWYCVPNCSRAKGKRSVISRRAISKGDVYIVVDRALDAQTTERKREMVRT